jgi:hypothetical protein
MILLSFSAFSCNAQEYSDDFLVVSAQYVSRVNMTKTEQKKYCTVFDCESYDYLYKLQYRIIKSFTSQKKNPKIVEVFADCKYCFQNKYQLLFIIQSNPNFLYEFIPIYPTRDNKWATSYYGIEHDVNVYIENLDVVDFYPLVKFPLAESTKVKKENILDQGIYKIDDKYYFLNKGLYIGDYFEKYFPVVLDNYGADIEANEIKRENF